MAIDKYTLKDGSTKYRATTYVHGQRIQKRGFRTKRDAKRWIEETRVTGLSATSTTYQALVDDWLIQYKPTVRPSTYSRTVTILNHICDEWGDRIVSTITARDAQALANKLSYEYVKFDKMITYASAIMKYGVNNDVILSNPFDKIKKPMQHKKSQPYQLWEIEDLQRFLDICKSDKRKILYPLYRMIAYTGLRRQEVVALRWTDINGYLLTIDRAITFDEDGHQMLGDTKNEASRRVIALDQGTLDALEEWHQFNPDQRIFPVSISYPNNQMQKIIKANNLPPCSVHKLRHLHCTILINAGAQIKDVQERLGHADIDTTLSIYAHANRNKKLTADLFSEQLLHDHYTEPPKPQC